MEASTTDIALFRTSTTSTETTRMTNRVGYHRQPCWELSRGKTDAPKHDDPTNQKAQQRGNTKTWTNTARPGIQTAGSSRCGQQARDKQNHREGERERERERLASDTRHSCGWHTHQTTSVSQSLTAPHKSDGRYNSRRQRDRQQRQGETSIPKA